MAETTLVKSKLAGNDSVFPVFATFCEATPELTLEKLEMMETEFQEMGAATTESLKQDGNAQ